MAIMLERHRTLRRCPVRVRRSRWDTLHWWWERRAARDSRFPVTLGSPDDALYFWPGMVISYGADPLRVIGVALSGVLRTVVDRWPWGDWGDGGDD
jgi:hypothetical protein